MSIRLLLLGVASLIGGGSMGAPIGSIVTTVMAASEGMKSYNLYLDSQVGKIPPYEDCRWEDATILCDNNPDLVKQLRGEAENSRIKSADAFKSEHIGPNIGLSAGFGAMWTLIITFSCYCHILQYNKKRDSELPLPKTSEKTKSKSQNCCLRFFSQQNIRETAPLLELEVVPTSYRSISPKN